MTRPADPRWVRTALLLLLGIQLISLWPFSFFPTQDGPSHLANALMLADYHENPLYRELYELNLQPFPNWFSHAVLAAMLRAAIPPLVAEKLLVCLYVVGFVAAFSYLLRAVVPDPGWLALLALPFACNYLVHMGFYNFAFSVVLYLTTLGYWWRRRDTLRGRDALVLNLLLVASYFCHIVGSLLALGSLLGLALLTARTRSARATAAPFWMLAPSYPLPGLYLARELGSLGGGAGLQIGGLGELLSLGSLASYELQRWMVSGPIALLLAGLAAAVVRSLLASRRAAGDGRLPPFLPSDAFAVLAALLAAASLVAPDEIGSGAFVKARLVLFVPLAGVAALAPRLTLRKSPLLGAALAALALAQLGLNARYYAAANADLEEYVSGGPALEPGERIFPLTFSERGSLYGSRIGYLRHAGNYYALLDPVVNTWNYEAETSYFPVVYRAAHEPGVDRPDPTSIGYHLEGFEPSRFRQRIDVIVAWELEEAPSLRDKVERFYAPVYASPRGRLRIFRRRE